MLCDFSVSVLDTEGKEVVDQEPEMTPDGKPIVVPGTNQAVMKRKDRLPLMHWIKMVCGNRLEGDPENREHYRKMMAVCAKLDRATELKVDFTTETISWIRARIVKAKLFPGVYNAFEAVTDPLRDDEIAAL